MREKRRKEHIRMHLRCYGEFDYIRNNIRAHNCISCEGEEGTFSECLLSIEIFSKRKEISGLST